jgi:hypothetical protein
MSAGKAAPEPDEVEIEERKAMGGVPESYLDAWAHHQVRKPMQVSGRAMASSYQYRWPVSGRMGRPSRRVPMAPANLLAARGRDIWPCVDLKRPQGPEFAGLGNGAQVFRQETAFVVMRVEQRQLLMAVHYIAGVVDVERNGRRLTFIGNHPLVNERPCEADREGAFSSRDNVGCEHSPSPYRAASRRRA